MKHTPGPWSFQPGDSVVYISGDRTPIAHTDTKAYYQRHDEQDIANARLIAAAPDLLAALKSVTNEWREGYGLCCIDQVRAAIAKAEELAHSHSKGEDAA